MLPHYDHERAIHATKISSEHCKELVQELVVVHGALVHWYMYNVQCTFYMLHWYMVHWYSGTVVYGALVQLHHSKHWCMHVHQAGVAILQSGG